MKISLIEDEPDCFVGYTELLSARGHDIAVYQEADDVIPALNQIAATDVVILDLMIQLGTIIRPNEAKETGIAIYKRLRKLAPELRFVIITARSKEDIWDDFKNDVNSIYLGKPVSDLEEFYRVIEGSST